MECPGCGAGSKSHAARCRACGAIFESADLEQINQLEFLRERLVKWGEVGLLPSKAAAQVVALTDREIEDCLGKMTDQSSVQTARLPTQPTIPLAAPVFVVPVQSKPARDLSKWGLNPTTVGAPTVKAGKLVPPRGVAPPKPAKPAKPAFSWKQVGIYLMSERTLNGLLGIGAFLILAAAVVISTVNPTGLSPLPHLGMMLATTAVFYAAGIIVRRKLDLARTGAALLGIGAAFIPLDTLTLGRDILQLDWAMNWLAASILCLPLYLISHLVLRGRAFALLSAGSGASLVLAAGNQFGAPSAWTCSALSLLAICYLLLGHRIHRDWMTLAWSLFWTAQVLTPFAMVTLLAARLLPSDVLNNLPSAWQSDLLAQRGAALDYAAGAAWWLGVVFYLLAARTSGQRVWRDIAAWVLPFAFLFTLTKAPWSTGWDGFCLAPMALGYLLYGRFVIRLPRQANGAYRYRDTGREGVFQVALVLGLAAAAWPWAQFTSEIVTLATLSLTFAAAALLLRQRAWAYVAAYLVVTIQIRRQTVPSTYINAAKHLRLEQISASLTFALVAALMLAVGEYLVRRSGESQRPFPETALGLGAWRSIFSGALFSAGYGCAVLAVGFAFSDGTTVDRLSPTAIAGLLVVVGILAISAVTRRTGPLLYPAVGLLLAPFSAVAIQLAHDHGTTLSDPALARFLALFGIGYLALAARLDGADGRYARPLYVAGYLLGVGTIVAALPDRAIYMQLIGLILLTYVWSAWRVHRDRFPSFTRLLTLLPSSPDRVVLSMLFQYLAVWLFPGWLLLLENLWRPAAGPADYGLVASALAPIYLALGLVFRRIRAEYRLPWFLAGYVLSALGPLIAAPDRNLSMAALALSIGVYAASAVWSRREEWLWLTAVLIPALLYQILYRFSDPMRFYGIALVALSVGYGLMGLTLQHRRVNNLFRPFKEPFGRLAVPFPAMGQILCVGGLIVGLGAHDQVLVFLAWSLGAGHYAAAYYLCRGNFNWPLALTGAAAYILGVEMTPAFPDQFGAALLPLAAAYLPGIELLRRRQNKADLRAERKCFRNLLAGWSMPFSLVGHGSALVAAVWAGAYLDTGAQNGTLVTVVWLVAALYGACAAISRRSRWIYPAMAYALAAYEVTIVFVVPGRTATTAFAANIVAVWLLFIACHVVSRTRSVPDPASRHPHPWTNQWARPLLLYGALVMGVSTVASLVRPIDGLSMLTAAAYTPLLVVFAGLWRDRVLAWGSVLLAAALYQEGLIVAGTPSADQPLYWTGAALLAACLGLVLHAADKKTTDLWVKPLCAAAVATWVLAGLTTMNKVADNHQALRTLTLILAIGSPACIVAGIRLRQSLYIVAGVVALSAAYILEMTYLNVTQPQAFAIPAGIAMYLLAYREWRQGDKPELKHLLEIGALAALLGTSLLQALGQFDAVGSRLPYEVILLLEGVAILAYGAALRWTNTFFAGGAAIVAGTLIVMAGPLSDLSVVYLILLIGCAMIAAVVFLEQRRREIPLWIDEVRVRLETWS